MQTKPRIFICYKHDIAPDEGLAKQIYEHLKDAYTVFRDKESILIGETWTERIQNEIVESDFFIPLLSAESVQSEMVKGEIELAHETKKKKKAPVILPVRVAYKEPFDSPLNVYLNSINWAYWEVPGDTDRLVKELENAIKGADLSIEVPDQSDWVSPSESSELPAPHAEAQTRLEYPEGTIGAHSKFYVARESDRIAMDAIAQDGGVTMPIKGPRQVGKSSLLIRTMEKAATLGKKVVFLDFQLFDHEALTDADIFFPRLCSWISHKLRIEDRVKEHWKRDLGNSVLCTDYITQYVLDQIDTPLVLAMDEVERVFASEFRSDFFSMLRSWHNERAYTPELRRLDLVLVTSTEPYQLIDNLHQSPFNVGVVIEMNDFEEHQVGWLNKQHNKTFSESSLKNVYEYLHGHPYLTRRAMYLVASGRYHADDLINGAADERGPFGDHLRYHLFRMHGKTELIEGLMQVLHDNQCDDQEIFWRLRGAGLVRREGGKIVPRCKLYGEYFKARLS